jgi:hypothetical protein
MGTITESTTSAFQHDDMSLSVHMFMDIVSEILPPSLKDVHCGFFAKSLIKFVENA